MKKFIPLILSLCFISACRPTILVGLGNAHADFGVADYYGDLIGAQYRLQSNNTTQSWFIREGRFEEFHLALGLNKDRDLYYCSVEGQILTVRDLYQDAEGGPLYADASLMCNSGEDLLVSRVPFSYIENLINIKAPE